jgi:Predicted phosphohydrolases
MRLIINKAFKLKKLTVLLILFFGVTLLYSQSKPALKFSDNGKFKIVQFTDIHLKVEKKQRCDSVLDNMKAILSSEKPDLVILTGDIATSKEVKEAWAMVTKPMIDAGIPWAVVFGNHDSEHGFTNKQIMDYLVTLPLNLSAYGPSDISGIGNYILEILGSKTNKPEALIYCFDSNAYSGEKDNKELGYYDWIKFDQIMWYRAESKKYTALNNNKPYPAMAFFHIPFPEYVAVQKKSSTIGDKDENISSSVINSGMYNAILESKDVMATFCGHDHNNNFIGTLNNIALVYGCKTGKDSYGKLDKGGRVIVLYEGERKFDTWIHTTNDSVKYFVTYPDAFKK